jgi:hypothetical protein
MKQKNATVNPPNYNRFYKCSSTLRLLLPSIFDTVSKWAIKPFFCNWSGCTATINCWVMIQKVSDVGTVYKLGICFLISLST